MPRIEYNTKISNTDSFNSQLVREGKQIVKSYKNESEKIVVEQDIISNTNSNSTKVNILKVNMANSA